MDTQITPRLQTVNNLRSILPTGRLKIQKGKLLQEATVIVHKQVSEDEPVGVYTHWFAASLVIVDEVRSN